MNRNHLWKLIFILLVLFFAVYEMYPPTSRPLVDYFQERAVQKDETLNGIVERARALNQEYPQRTYASLLQAIGTNDITRYFPYVEAEKQTHPTTYILNYLQKKAAGKIKLGIDLAGGTSFTVQMDLSQLQNSGNAGIALSQAVEVLRNRVDKFGVAEPVIQPQGEDRILIQLPGLSEEVTATARETIQKVAFLEFRLVHPQSDQLLKQGITSRPNYELMRTKRVLANGEEKIEEYLVKKTPEMTGGIKSAFVSRDNLGRPQISFTLDSEHASKFGQITREHVGELLAIVLDKELQTAPEIRSPIEGGTGEITGSYTEREAFDLANVLENPLQAPLQIIDEQKIDPTLGKDSIRSGVKAAIIGVIGVAAFMLVYYLFAGVIANVALLLNIIILLGIMVSVNTTLTLPGIAGIVLTIGMAVDANVLIFERIREETASGKSMRGALSAGYDKAFGTIFDSNLTTLISSVILIFKGTGPVKGFGVTLTIGVLVSMFTALVVTRLIFDYLLSKNWMKTLPMLHIVRGSNFDFMKWAMPAFVASWILIVVGNGYGIFVRGSDVLGVEFVGGESITMSFDQQHKIDTDKLREVAQKASGADVLVAYQSDIGTGIDTLRVTARATGKQGEEAAGDKIFQALRTAFPEAKFGGEKAQLLSDSRVGPTVGQEIQRNAVVAALLALFGILIYVAFRYEFSFAVGAVVAIIHDILMTLGWYFLAGHELNATTVAALLTIIGFSINDTIVIFDRIREDLKLGVRGTFKEVMNKALNQTLSRTIITSGTVFLSTLSLYLFGGGVINDFSFAFLIGILTGTYSSIYIACLIVLRWHKGQRPALGSTQVAMDATVTARG